MIRWRTLRCHAARGSPAPSSPRTFSFSFSPTLLEQHHRQQQQQRRQQQQQQQQLARAESVQGTESSVASSGTGGGSPWHGLQLLRHRDPAAATAMARTREQRDEARTDVLLYAAADRELESFEADLHPDVSGAQGVGAITAGSRNRNRDRRGGERSSRASEIRSDATRGREQQQQQQQRHERPSRRWWQDEEGAVADESLGSGEWGDLPPAPPRWGSVPEAAAEDVQAATLHSPPWRLQQQRRRRPLSSPPPRADGEYDSGIAPDAAAQRRAPIGTAPGGGSPARWTGSASREPPKWSPRRRPDDQKHRRGAVSAAGAAAATQGVAHGLDSTGAPITARWGSAVAPASTSSVAASGFGFRRASGSGTVQHSGGGGGGGSVLTRDQARRFCVRAPPSPVLRAPARPGDGDSEDHRLLIAAIQNAISSALRTQRGRSLNKAGASSKSVASAAVGSPASSASRYSPEVYAQVSLVLMNLTNDVKNMLKQPKFGGLVRAMKAMPETFAVSHCGMYVSSVSIIREHEEREESRREAEFQRREAALEAKRAQVTAAAATPSSGSPAAASDGEKAPGRRATMAPSPAVVRYEAAQLMRGGSVNADLDLMTQLKLAAATDAARLTKERPADELRHFRPLYNKAGVMLAFINVAAPPMSRDDVDAEVRWRKAMAMGLHKIKDNSGNTFDAVDVDSLASMTLDDFSAHYEELGLPSATEMANSVLQFVPTYFVEVRQVMRVLPPLLRDMLNPRGDDNAKPVRVLAEYPMLFTCIEPKFSRPVVRLNKASPLARAHRDYGLADRHLRQFDLDHLHRGNSRLQLIEGADSVIGDCDGQANTHSRAVAGGGDEGGGGGGAGARPAATHAAPARLLWSGTPPPGEERFRIASLPGDEDITQENIDEKIFQILVAHLPRGENALASHNVHKFFALVPWINSFPAYHLSVLNLVPQERVLTIMANHPRIFQVSGTGDSSYVASVPEWETATQALSHGKTGGGGGEQQFETDDSETPSHQSAVQHAMRAANSMERQGGAAASAAASAQMTPAEQAEEKRRVRRFTQALDDEMVGMEDILLGAPERATAGDVLASGGTVAEMDSVESTSNVCAGTTDLPAASSDSARTASAGSDGFDFFEPDEEIDGTGLEAIRVRRLPRELAPRCTSNYDFATSPAPELLYAVCCLIPPPPIAVPRVQSISNTLHKPNSAPMAVSRTGVNLGVATAAAAGGTIVTSPYDDTPLSQLPVAVQNAVKMLCAFWSRVPRRPRLLTPQSVASVFPFSDYQWMPIPQIYNELSDAHKKQLKDFKGLTGFLKMHGALFEVSADKNHVIAHDPTRCEGYLPPLVPTQTKLIAGERVILPRNFDADDVVVGPDGKAPHRKGETLPFVVGAKELSQIRELLGTTRGSMPTTRTQLVLIDPVNPLIDSAVLCELIAAMLPDHEVTVDQLFRRLPPLMRASLPHHRATMLERSPLFTTWKSKYATMIQRASLGRAPAGHDPADTCTVPEALDVLRALVPLGGTSEGVLSKRLLPAVRRCIKAVAPDLMMFIQRHPNIFFVEEASTGSYRIHLVEHLRRFRQGNPTQ